MKSETAYVHQIQYKIKKDIFRPIFMNFPFLDNFGFPSRQKARELASHFTDQLVSELEGTCIDDKTHDYAKNKLPRALLDARQDGTFTDQQFRDNVTILFVAGQENPQLSIISTLYLLAKHPVRQKRPSEKTCPYGSTILTIRLCYSECTRRALQGVPATRPRPNQP